MISTIVQRQSPSVYLQVQDHVRIEFCYCRLLADLQQNLQIGISRSLFRPLILQLPRCNGPLHGREHVETREPIFCPSTQLNMVFHICYPWVCIIHTFHEIFHKVNTPFDKFDLVPERNHWSHHEVLRVNLDTSQNPKWLHFFRPLHIKRQV